MKKGKLSEVWPLMQVNPAYWEKITYLHSKIQAFKGGEGRQTIDY